MPIVLIALSGLFGYAAYKGGINETLTKIGEKTSDTQLGNIAIIGGLGAGVYYYSPSSRLPITMLVVTYALTLDYGIKS